MRHRIFALGFGLLFLAGCKTGTLSGTVTFKGVPCPPESADNKVPPCQGPYPHYEVKIFPEGSDAVTATTLTDESGAFKTKLQPGKYRILAQYGIAAEIVKAYEFTVEKGKSVKVDVTVSTGIQ